MGNVDFNSLSPVEGTRLRGGEKLKFVTQLFDTIAGSYDALNWFISLGQTTIWRYLALRHLRGRLRKDDAVLDVGCGTGWVSRYLHKTYPELRLQVEGIDCSEGMLGIARVNDPCSTFRCGDVCNMDAYEDNSFDCVITVYTLRNFPDIQSALSEMVRVIKPGGTLLILDAFPPKLAVVRWAIWLWLGTIVPRVAALFSSDKAYRYLSCSIQSTIPAASVARSLSELGCEQPMVRLYSFGAAGCLMTSKGRSDDSPPRRATGPNHNRQLHRD